MTPKQALKRAAEIVGGQAKLARIIGMSRQNLNQATQCPANRVIDVERAVAKALATRPVTRFDLRPDIFKD